MAGMKRQRGRGRKSGGGHNQNRNFESNGPDIKIRGSAANVYEKYQQLARDAQSSGDRVAAESYLQHAEHYFRVLRSQQQHMQRENPEGGPRGDQGGYANGRDEYDDAPGGETGNAEPQAAPSSSSSSSGPLDVVDPEAVEASGDDRDEGRTRRPRRRRRYEGSGPDASGESPEGAPSASLDQAPSS